MIGIPGQGDDLAVCHAGDHGAGIAFAKLGDSRGYFGRAVQSLVIEPRSQASA